MSIEYVVGGKSKTLVFRVLPRLNLELVLAVRNRAL